MNIHPTHPLDKPVNLMLSNAQWAYIAALWPSDVPLPNIQFFHDDKPKGNCPVPDGDYAIKAFATAPQIKRMAELVAAKPPVAAHYYGADQDNMDLLAECLQAVITEPYDPHTHTHLICL